MSILCLLDVIYSWFLVTPLNVYFFSKLWDCFFLVQMAYLEMKMKQSNDAQLVYQNPPDLLYPLTCVLWNCESIL